ncbi:SDR family oxidoreductase [Labrys sp. 22185]|uniref:SDR family oxidoreductase n=1 Tax=Labrys sp. 22185 TaxID=3453888 RepID=UPI003F849F0C
MTIGVTGAAGQLGRFVLASLRKRGAGNVVALVRSQDKAVDLGVQVREADYDVVATLDSSLKGIDTLLLISSSEVGKRKAQHANVIAAAARQGVKHIVYTSLLRADSSPLSLAEEHLATEKDLKASGLPVTILRNSWYTENYTGSIGGALAGGAFIGSAGDGRISSAARADYAEAAAIVLTSDGHIGRTYELAGDTSYTLTELAAEISRQSGRDIPYRNLSVADYAAVLAGFGLPEPLAHAIAGWDFGASQGGLFDDGHELSRLLGRPTTSLGVSVAEALSKLA